MVRDLVIRLVVHDDGHALELAAIRLREAAMAALSASSTDLSHLVCGYAAFLRPRSLRRSGVMSPK